MNNTKVNYTINPEVLKWARVTIGFSSIVAAEKLGVEVLVLNKWEDGSEEVPLKKLKKIADVYKRATTVFLLNTIPDENISAKFRKLLYDNIESFSTETLLAIRKAIRIQNIAKDVLDIRINKFLEQLHSYSTRTDYDLLGLELIRVLDLDEKIITKSKSIYEQLNLWKNAIEAKGVYILELGFPADEAKGFAIYDSEAPIIVINTHDHPKVRIFTLIHELCHFIFNSDAIDDKSTLFNFSSDNSIEAKCNQLAGSILIPAVYLQDKISKLQLDIDNDLETSLEVLTRVFHVSKQVALRRLYTEKYIPQNKFVSMQHIFNTSYVDFSYGNKKQKGGNYYVNFVKNNSRAFIYDILDAYRVNKISHFEVLNVLNIKSSTLNQLETRI